MSNPAYRAGYVDGAMAREPTPERYGGFAGFYDYRLGHKDANQDLREGHRDPAMVVADYGWMVAEEARRRNLNNIVLTGAPRCGTTLACHLLNKLPDTLALHEPIRPAQFVDPEAGPDMVLAAMERFFNEQRQQAREQGTVASKGVGGVVPDDPYEPDPEPGARIRFQKVRGDEFGDVAIGEKSLGSTSRLIVKDPAMLSALLPTLVERFPCYAIVRNPLSVLGSWSSVNHNVRRGRSPAAERYDFRLSRRLEFIENRVERQLHLLDWFFSQTAQNLPDDHVVRYEDMIATGGGALSAIDPDADRLYERLESRNLNAAYDRGAMRMLGKQLLNSEGAYWHYYSKKGVKELIRGI